MNVEIHPGQPCGVITAPPSKSMAHRLLICAGLCQGVSHIRGVDFNEDISATVDCLRALGAVCTVQGDTVTVQGTDVRAAKPKPVLACRESGSTLRFFIPLALLSNETFRFTGTEKLLSRPLGIYASLCRERGFRFQQSPSQVEVQGHLQAGEFTVAGDVSSQFITGLLFALSLTEGDSVIRLIPPVESRSYVNLTLEAMASFGVEPRWQDENTLFIPGGSRYQPRDMTVEGDYSGAAFFGALKALGGDIQITGLREDSLQGDKIYEKHLQSICTGTPTIDLSDCPDLGPVLFAAAAAKNGAVFTGTRRLKIKESDRAAAMAQELAAFGTEVTVEENSVTVSANPFHPPLRPLQGHNDHRIVMSLAVLLTLTGGTIEGAEAVRKSFPDFFEKLSALGIEVITYETDK